MGDDAVKIARRLLAVSMSFMVVFPGYAGTLPANQVSAESKDSSDLAESLRQSYLDLFRTAHQLGYTHDEIEEMRNNLEHAKDNCINAYKNRSKEYERDSDKAMQDLKQETNSITDSQRHEIHCRIQNLRILRSHADILSSKGIPIAYDNRLAKLELIEKWPQDERQIRQEIEDRSYQKRRWGNVNDIGFREIEPDQKKDIKTGEDAVKQLEEMQLLPPKVTDSAITDYVKAVANRVAGHSDLHIPLHVTVLNAKEINAFALPGGFLYIERGLLDAADDEAELAGVIGHEIAHDVARHAHKMMVRGSIASILFQAAAIAAEVATGGIASVGASIAAYYGLQYGFYGLGLVLDLALLGVSREYELQADQLGIQYAWNSGYDPSGFIRFFDKMATKEGYVTGIGWFNDHPPFYERMVDAEREIMFLPKKQDLIVQTQAFKQMKTALAKITAQAEKEAKEYSELPAQEPGCTKPKTVEYKAGDSVDKVCPPPS
jgi:Zn-dependent protease with chaperone function